MLTRLRKSISAPSIYTLIVLVFSLLPIGVAIYALISMDTWENFRLAWQGKFEYFGSNENTWKEISSSMLWLIFIYITFSWGAMRIVKYMRSDSILFARRYIFGLVFVTFGGLALSFSISIASYSWRLFSQDFWSMFLTQPAIPDRLQNILTLSIILINVFLIIRTKNIYEYQTEST